jgi:hypothetical protein
VTYLTVFRWWRAYLVEAEVHGNSNHRRRIMDLKGASEAMTQRAQQNALENKQKEQENEEQLKALETFGKALQKAGQI